LVRADAILVYGKLEHDNFNFKKLTNPKLSKRNFKEKEKLVTGPRWAPDTRADWPTGCRS
jgi:hypothetical protein